MKKLALLLLTILLFSSSVFAQLSVSDLTLVAATLNADGTVNPGTTLNLSVKLTNAGAAPLADTTIKTDNVVNVNNNQDILISALTLKSGITVPANDAVTEVVSLTIPGNAKAGDYQSTLDVISGAESDSEVYTFKVAHVPSFEIKLNNQVLQDLKVALESGEDSNVLTLVVKNTGNKDLKNVELSTQFTNTDDDGDLILVTLPNKVAELKINQEASFTFNFDVETGFDLSSLAGKLLIKSDEIVTPLARNLTLDVKPLACQPNSRPGDLDLEDDNLDDIEDEEYVIGDVVDVVLNVRNNNEDENMDTKIKAVLYNKNDNRKEESLTLSKKVKDDDTEELRLSFDLSDLEEEDDLVIFLKIFDEDDDLASCLLEDADVDVEIPDHKVNLQDITLSPSTVLCGEQVAGSVLLRNVGDEDESVLFSLYSTQLGLSKSAPQFELEDIDSADNEQLVNFAFNVPENALTGDYTIYFKTEYSGESTLKTSQLSITCPETPAQPVQTSETQSSSSVVEQHTTQPITGATTFEEKSLFDMFKTPEFNVPTLVWVLLDVLLGLLIISTLVWLFTRNR